MPGVAGGDSSAAGPTEHPGRGYGVGFWHYALSLVVLLCLSTAAFHFTFSFPGLGILTEYLYLCRCNTTRLSDMSKKDKIQHRKVKGTEMVYRSFSLPASLIEDLKLLKDSYEETWKEDEGVKERVTYEKIFERLLSKSGLGHVDPDVYEEFVKAKETRKAFPAVVTRATRGAVGEIFRRMHSNGTSLLEEALKEQEEAKAALKEDLAAAAAADAPAPASDQVSPEPVATPLPQEGKKTEKRFVHPDGRSYKAVPGDRVNWVPVDEKGNWLPMKTVKGFVLMDVEV